MIINLQETSKIKKILSEANGVLVIVDKKREIYFIDNVKFHLDQVQDLGSFVEIEAIDNGGHLEEKEQLLKQCQEYLDLFEIKEENLIDCSYSDLFLNKNF